MGSSVMVARMQKELLMLAQSPPPGVSAWAVDGKINMLEAVIQGPEDTPYSEGFFKLEINIPDRYPNDPPKVRFITPVYHPNIDNGGRICLDTLKMPPKGAWTPSLNIPTLLTTLRLLLSTPNPDDPLIYTEEFIHNYKLFVSTAKNWTKKHATNTIDEATKASTIITNNIPSSSANEDISNNNKSNSIPPKTTTNNTTKSTDQKKEFKADTKRRESKVEEDEEEGEEEGEEEEEESDDEELMMLAKKKNQILNSNSIVVKVSQKDAVSDGESDSDGKSAKNTHKKEESDTKEKTKNKNEIPKPKQDRKDEIKASPKKTVSGDSDSDDDLFLDSSPVKLLPSLSSSSSKTSQVTKTKIDDDNDFKTMDKRKESPVFSTVQNKKIKK